MAGLGNPVTRCASQVPDPADGEHQHNHEEGAAPVGAHGGRGLNDEQKAFVVILNEQGYRKPKELTREWDRRKRRGTEELPDVPTLSKLKAYLQYQRLIGPIVHRALAYQSRVHVATPAPFACCVGGRRGQVPFRDLSSLSTFPPAGGLDTPAFTPLAIRR